jgi:mediator of RNA polymerase II transcription subunit 5
MAPSSLEQWRTFLQQCFIRRLNAGTFRSLAQALSRRAPVTENSLLDVILEVRDSLKVQWDPLLPLYVDDLIKAGSLKVSSVLGGLLKHSSIRLDGPIPTKDGGASDPNKVTATPGRKTRRACTIMIDTRIIQDIRNSISGGSILISTEDAANIFAIVAEWILALATWHNSQVGGDQPSNGLIGSLDAISLFESLGILFTTVSDTDRGPEALSSESPDGQ